MPKRIECDPSEATVAAWGSVECAPVDWHGVRLWTTDGDVRGKYLPEYMLERGAKFYKEVFEPCVVQYDAGGDLPVCVRLRLHKTLFGGERPWERAANRTLLVLLLKEGADAQKVYEQVLKVEGVEA